MCSAVFYSTLLYSTLYSTLNRTFVFQYLTMYYSCTGFCRSDTGYIWTGVERVSGSNAITSFRLPGGETSESTHYLTRAVYSPPSDLVKAVLAGFWVPGFVWACTENLADRF